MEEHLIAILKENNIDYDEKYLMKVINYAKENYGNKLRYSKQTLYEHSLGVAIEVAKLKLDITSIYACILHELVKTDVDFKDVTELFSKEIVDIIKGLGKVSYLNYTARTKIDENNLRKLFMAIAQDIRVVIIKLVDRLYNMRQANDMDEEFRLLKAKENLEIYSPIAHRLGISHIKSELEDISFRILYKDEYASIKKKIDIKKHEREEYINNKIEELNKELKDNNVKATIIGRPKHFYSIYKKMKEKGCDIDGIFDLLAIRIIVNSIKDCYIVLGIIHSKYKPMPGRFKDYIAMPKTNNYQSLHTTVFGNNNSPFEVQIRTWDMQRFAEYGAAAHFIYKEKTTSMDATEQKILWIRQTLELQKELSENVNNLKDFKGELFGEEVFVFTPKGDIKALPKGATTIDLAYNIHQNIAEKMIGSKINGKLVPIFTKLKNTDVVEIITAKNSKGPSFDWLKNVKTHSARNKIIATLKKKDSKIYISRGKELFDKEIKKRKITKNELLKEELLSQMVKGLNLNTLDAVYENIGFGNLSYVKAVNRLVEEYSKKYKSDELKSKVVNRKMADNKSAIVVEGLTNCLIKFSKCCSPIPGDDIIGYITYSKGVSIHRKDCSNLKDLDITNRKINVKWKDKIKTVFSTNLIIFANYREAVTIDIIKKVNDLGISFEGIKANKTDGSELIINLTITAENIESVNKVIREIKKIDSVYEVKRAR